MTDTPPTSSQRPSPALIIFLMMPLLGIIAAIIMIVQNERQKTSVDYLDLPAETERLAAALINYEAPPFTVKDLDGQTVSLSDYQGRIVFLNFWTTDCRPCEKEMPAFEMFMSEQDETGPSVLTVNMGESEEAINSFFTRINVNGIRVAMDTTLDVGRAYSIIGRPVTYVIDEQGIIRSMRAGEITIEDLDAYVAQLEAPPATQEAETSDLTSSADLTQGSS